MGIRSWNAMPSSGGSGFIEGKSTIIMTPPQTDNMFSLLQNDVNGRSLVYIDWNFVIARQGHHDTSIIKGNIIFDDESTSTITVTYTDGPLTSDVSFSDFFSKGMYILQATVENLAGTMSISHYSPIYSLLNIA